MRCCDFQDISLPLIREIILHAIINAKTADFIVEFDVSCFQCDGIFSDKYTTPTTSYYVSNIEAFDNITTITI